MKKLIGFALLIILAIVFISIRSIQNSSQPIKSTTPHLSSPALNKKEKTALFVPYWTIGEGATFDTRYDSYIYFGILANSTGIDTQEDGYKKLPLFSSLVADAQKYLAVRMVNTEDNRKILKNPESEKKIIEQAIFAAKSQGFGGVLLDFETSSFPFEDVIQRISSFVRDFSKSAARENLLFSVALYGDTFYRLRPFDTSSIAKDSDAIFIMAYDFHKANGEPGPNFPLSGKEQYGYDFRSMIDDFLRVVPRDKITVIFGLFGYDWTIDEKGRSIKVATPLTYTQIKTNYIERCLKTNCEVRQDTDSSEMFVEYKDTDGKHIIWFETPESIEKKKEYLKTRGINSTAFWAYSYF